MRPLRLLSLLPLVVACGEGGTGPDTTPVASLAVEMAPPEAIRGFPLSTHFVLLRGQSDDPLPIPGVEIRVSVSDGSVSGTTRVETNDQGFAIFENLIVRGDPGVVTLRYACCDLPPAVHQLTLLDDPADRRAFTESP